MTIFILIRQNMKQIVGLANGYEACAVAAAIVMLFCVSGGFCTCPDAGWILINDRDGNRY